MILLHNPRCSKSRAAKTLLEERGIAFEVRDYLKEPLDLAELTDLHAKLGRPVAQWVRFGEAEAKENGIQKDAGDEALLAAIAAHPKLLERPILVDGARAAVGRPGPEALEPLLS
ncbi:MAG: arsenate reductase family protein [Thermoplasmatota archaeon]